MYAVVMVVLTAHSLLGHQALRPKKAGVTLLTDA